MGKKILIVDDSGTIRQQVRFALEKSGYEVLEADDGQNGLSKVDTIQDIALVITDINMPNMNGIEMLQKIKSNSAHASLPVVILTTEGKKELMSEAKQAGAKGWLVKPFQPDQLLTVVTKLAG